ncbi:MAG: RidA family protein [Roseibium sp.]|uniref:RidA family protein n=1 Tax=Roseibium sp. TaxID=1936156 RepID=UPI001B205C09|nr:RidA family protein [Roseibium sp.]MBO6892027.1 RidA family protein [Roseibium sp.]MBO6929310.1 RidA family protein [Roseibium sp.]
MPHLRPAWRDGSTLYLSGQLAFDDKGAICGDIAEQTERTLDNLESVLLTHGVNRTSIMRASVYLTDRSDFVAFDTAYAAFFGNHIPARSAIICDLVFDTALIEIDVIAKIG